MDASNEVQSVTTTTVRSYHKNGNLRAEGYICDGLKTGRWTYWYADGRVAATGEYNNGRRNGRWKVWLHRADGFTRYDVGFYQDGRRQGYWSLVYPKGITRGRYEGGRRNGPWRKWYRKNTGPVCCQAETFSHGEMTGVCVFTKNAIVKDICYCENGDIVGERLSFANDGMLVEREWWEHGEHVWSAVQP